jgi:hypothetical protein
MKFDENGICYPCRAAEHVKKTDWKKRWEELEKLADKYRGMNGDYYDCINAVSGGKDSYYQTYVMKEKLGLNPLLVSVDNQSWTQTGRHNWDNMRTTFGVDAHVMSPSPQVCKNLFRKALEKLGSPTWYFDRAAYAYPLQIACKLNLPLVIYGEDTNFLYGGPLTEETPSAMKQLNNDVTKPVPWDMWLDDKVTMKDVNPGMYPTQKEMEKLLEIGLNETEIRQICNEMAAWAERSNGTIRFKNANVYRKILDWKRKKDLKKEEKKQLNKEKEARKEMDYSEREQKNIPDVEGKRQDDFKAYITKVRENPKNSLICNLIRPNGGCTNAELFRINGRTLHSTLNYNEVNYKDKMAAWMKDMTQEFKERDKLKNSWG